MVKIGQEIHFFVARGGVGISYWPNNKNIVNCDTRRRRFVRFNVLDSSALGTTMQVILPDALDTTYHDDDYNLCGEITLDDYNLCGESILEFF